MGRRVAVFPGVDCWTKAATVCATAVEPAPRSEPVVPADRRLQATIARIRMETGIKEARFLFINSPLSIRIFYIIKWSLDTPAFILLCNEERSKRGWGKMD
jgi:hypothetical protein